MNSATMANRSILSSLSSARSRMINLKTISVLLRCILSNLMKATEMN